MHVRQFQSFEMCYINKGDLTQWIHECSLFPAQSFIIIYTGAIYISLLFTFPKKWLVLVETLLKNPWHNYAFVCVTVLDIEGLAEVKRRTCLIRFEGGGDVV